LNIFGVYVLLLFLPRRKVTPEKKESEIFILMFYFERKINLRKE
jgi:hypothetical protein